MKAKLLPWVIVLVFLGVIAGVVLLVERISCSIVAKKAESAYSAGDFVNAGDSL